MSKLLQMDLYDYQKVGSQFAIDRKYTIIGDEMGLGKTPQAIATALKLNLKTLIVTPAFLKLNWMDEINKWSNVWFNVKVITQWKQMFKLNLKNLDAVIINYECVKYAEHLFNWAGYVIADEAHLLKSLDAHRTLFFHQYIETGKPEYLTLLTGTPIKNRVREIYSLMVLCGYNPNKTFKPIWELFPSDYDFACYFSHRYKVKARGRYMTQFRGSKHEEELKSLMDDFYIRRMAEDFLDLPPIVDKEIVVDYNKKDSKLLAEWEKFEETGGGSKHLSTVKLNSALIKAPFTAKYCETLLQTEDSLAVFTDHPDAARLIANKLEEKSIKCGIIDGSTSMDRRHELVRQIQAGELTVLCATIGAAGTGLNLTRSRNIVFNDVSWVPGDNVQAKKRIHRIGQFRSCVAHYIAGSLVDRMLTRSIRSKEKTIERIL